MIEAADSSKAAVRAAASQAHGDVLAILEPGARAANNWISATTPFLGREEIVAVVVPKMAPHVGPVRRRAAAAIAESRLGGGSLYFRYTPGNLRYVKDFPGSSVIVDRTRYLALGEPVATDDLPLRLSDAGHRVLYTPETVVVAPAPPLFAPHLERTRAYGRRRGGQVRLRGVRALRPSTLLPIALLAFVAFGPVAIILGGAMITVWGIAAAAYLAAISASGVFAALRFRSAAVGVVATAGLVATHVAYALRLRPRSRGALMRHPRAQLAGHPQPPRGRSRASHARDRQAAGRPRARGDVVHVETRRARRDRGCRRCASRPARLGADDAAARAAVRASGAFDVIVEEINTLPYFAPLWSRVPTVRAHQPARARGLVVRSAEASRSHRLGERARSTCRLTGGRRRSRFRNRLPPTCAGSGCAGAIDVIPMAVNTVPVTELSPKRLEGHLVSIGRLAPSKRYAHAIEALALLRRSHARATLTIVGEGQERAALAEQARRLGIADAVRLPGRLDEAAKTVLLTQADILVGTSAREGWGLTVTGGRASRYAGGRLRRPGVSRLGSARAHRAADRADACRRRRGCAALPERTGTV